MSAMYAAIGVGAVVRAQRAVFVAEEVELVDVERGEAVAQLGVAQRARAAPAARSPDRSCRARRAWR